MDITVENLGRAGIGFIKRGSIYAIIVAILEFLFISRFTVIINSVTLNGLHMPAGEYDIFYILMLISIAGLIILTFGIANYRKGFRNFKDRDTRFSKPFSYSKYVIVLYIIFIIVYVFILAVLPAFNHNTYFPALSSSGTLIHVFLVLLLISALIVLIISVLALIGFIYILIGLYRFSEMVHQEIGELGAILYIIPIANIVSPFLIYLASSRAEKLRV
ncbi:DUF973 family protein [Ferroplasma acidiphilum]|uniref:DUF973 family protein n=1 Tax=Ferroplasma acidiphilum TaxID=74969 RepID=A0A7K4FPY5_9ARCH|nr:DUF973 family protein [Ferroplasma acidiphilum]NOL61082.1 DUF973 family protein [Ferroplasma acidiphilum]